MISWLCIVTNALFKSSVFMSETAPFDTHKNKNSGATPT